MERTNIDSPARLAALLADYLRAWRSKPFDWHTAHCGHLADGWLHLVTGRHLLPHAGPGGQRAWCRLAQQSGSMRELVTASVGALPQAGALAAVGDLVLLQGQAVGGALGLCCGRTIACLDAYGLAHASISDAIASWSLQAIRRPATCARLAA